MACLALSRVRVSSSLSVLVLAGLTIGLLLVARATPQGRQAAYTLISTEARRTLPFRTANGVDMVPLDQLASLFGLRVTEDTLAGGLMIETRGQRILAVPGQSFVQAAGRVVQLSGPVTRERNVWTVPVDFVPLALGPATGQRILIRRASRLILIGDVRVPQVSVRAERTPNGGRVIVDIDPPAPHKVTREGNRLLVRFDATAIDAGAVAAQVPEYVTGCADRRHDAFADAGTVGGGVPRRGRPRRHAAHHRSVRRTAAATAPSAPTTAGDARRRGGPAGGTDD